MFSQNVVNKIILLITLTITTKLFKADSFAVSLPLNYQNRVSFLTASSTDETDSTVSSASSDDDASQLWTFAKSIEQHFTLDVDNINDKGEGGDAVEKGEESSALQFKNETEIELLPNSPPLSFGKFPTMQVKILFIISIRYFF